MVHLSFPKDSDDDGNDRDDDDGDTDDDFEEVALGAS